MRGNQGALSDQGRGWRMTNWPYLLLNVIMLAVDLVIQLAVRIA